MSTWIDELDLDPTSSWRRMGTRALGDRPWLLSDDRRDAELALKADLLEARRDEVLICAADAAAAAADVRHLVEAEGVVTPELPNDLEAAARSVQEDLCLLRRHATSWHLDAACVCFPSRWRLADKIGLPLVEVHAPTPGYAAHLDRRVSTLLDRLEPRPVLRRNWFVHPDPARFQPVTPAQEPVIPAGDVGRRLYLRSERQTLRRLASGWVLFTIRVQQEPLGEALEDGGHRQRFARYLREAPAGDLAHRGMAPPQVREVRLALA